MTDDLTPAELAEQQSELIVNLWGTKEIAAFFGVKQRTVTEKWTKKPGFPKPAQRISRKTVRWNPSDVRAWATAGLR